MEGDIGLLVLLGLKKFENGFSVVNTGLRFFFFFDLFRARKLDFTRGERPSGRTSGPDNKEFPLFPISFQ